MKTNLISLTTGVFCALVAAPAMAFSEAQTRVDSLSYTLTDLDLSDGITPALTFLGMRPVAELRAEAFEVRDTRTVSAGLPANITSTATYSRASASTSSAGGVPLNNASLSASGRADGRLQGQDDWANYSAAVSLPSLQFTLSPNTLLTVNGIAFASASLSSGYPAEGAAYADLNLRLAGDGLSNPGQQAENFTLGARAFIDQFNPQTPLSEDFQKSFSLRFANFSGVDTGGSLWLYASAWGYNVQPVPEPATWAMLFGGLGLISVSARRRADR